MLGLSRIRTLVQYTVLVHVYVLEYAYVDCSERRDSTDSRRPARRASIMRTYVECFESSTGGTKLLLRFVRMMKCAEVQSDS